jgi:hypothetical protein
VSWPLLHPCIGIVRQTECRRHGFLGGGVAAFTGTAFGTGAFFGFFFSLLCELLPFPIARTSVSERELAWAPPIWPPGESGKARAENRVQ